MTVEAARRVCSVCDRPLVPLVIGGETIWSCERCDGLISFRKAQHDQPE